MQWDWIKTNICSGHSNPKPGFCSGTPTPPTPPTAPTPTAPTPTAPTPTPPTGCSSGELTVDVSVTTDDYPNEISWTIQGSDGTSQRSDSFTAAFETYSKTLCLDPSVCQTFTVSDEYGDGIIYDNGGALSLTVENSQVVSNPVYTSSYEYTFGDCNAPTRPKPPTPTAPTPTAPTPTTCTGLEVDITFVTDGFPQENSWTVESSNGQNVYSEQFTSTFTSYESSLCLDSSLCHKFIVEDSYGDGLNAGGSFSLTEDGTDIYLFQGGDGVNFSTSQTEFGKCVVAPTPTAPTPTPPTQCYGIELDVAISVTTDDYPDEVSWSIGNQYQSEPFTASKTTYESKLCLNPAYCHTFVISDSYGDGLDPTAGGAFSLKVNGAIKLSLGDGFTNKLETKFGQCDETPTPSTPPTAPTPTPPTGCSSGNKKFKLKLTTDNNGSETSFKVMQRRPNGNFNKKVFAGNNFDSATDYIRSKCLKKNKCYRLVMYDSAGDGICCDFGQGSFQGYWKGVAVPNQNAQFTSGSFARSQPFGKC